MILFNGGIVLSEVSSIALADALIDPEEWITTVIQEKSARCQRRMVEYWVERLLSDPNWTDPIPSTAEEIILLVSQLPDYLPRSQRPEFPTE